MTILYLDFETYYDTEYSLTHLDPPSYILDHRFETIGCAVRREGEAKSTFIDGLDVPAYLAGIDPATTTTVAFNALFDNCILAYRYNFVPARMVCTMRMAVAMRGHELHRHSLAAVGERLGVGTKGDAIIMAKGKRRADLMGDPYLWRDYKDYACNDNDMSRAIFLKLIDDFPLPEHRTMDRVLRCAVVPRFVVDTQLLEDHLADLEKQRVQMLIDAGAETTLDDPDRDVKLEVFAKTLRSNVKFEQLLKEKGVEIQYKQSVTDPGRQIPAFAKTDSFMAELYDHDDVEVQTLAAARLGLRSTIERTRGERILNIARLNWPSYCHGNLPVPLKYAAAHTHRLGGDWKINMQNLPAGRGGKSNKLRRSLCAPPGHKVVVVDKAQIECRICAYICGEKGLLQAFRDKEDPYALMASRVFSFIPAKNSIERFIGKTAVLGLGYGCGPDRFYAMVISSARTLGIDMAVLDDIWSLQLAQRTVTTYRNLNSNIQQRWKWLDGIIQTVWSAGIQPMAREPEREFGPVKITKGCIEGPGGLCMYYGNPHFDADDQEFKFGYSGRLYKMYGAKMLENIVQFLSRINIMHDALRISDRGFPFALQAHDELVFIVPDDQVEECLEVALEEMRRPPSWAPDIPLDAEGSVGQSYGEAK